MRERSYREKCAVPLEVVDMLAPPRGVWSRFTDSDAELIGGHEVGPFMDLLSESLITVPNV